MAEPSSTSFPPNGEQRLFPIGDQGLSFFFSFFFFFSIFQFRENLLRRRLIKTQYFDEGISILAQKTHVPRM
jgi:hypothetical protein